MLLSAIYIFLDELGECSSELRVNQVSHRCWIKQTFAGRGEMGSRIASCTNTWASRIIGRWLWLGKLIGYLSLFFSSMNEGWRICEDMFGREFEREREREFLDGQSYWASQMARNFRFIWSRARSDRWHDSTSVMLIVKLFDFRPKVVELHAHEIR